MMALLGVPTIRKCAKEVPNAVSNPIAQGSPMPPLKMPIGRTMGSQEGSGGRIAHEVSHNPRKEACSHP